MAQEMMQHEARQLYTYYDEAMRPWEAIVDTRCKPHLAPCTPLIPKGWSAPIIPPGDCLVAHPRELGKLVTLWDKWLESQIASEAMYAQNMTATAERMFGDDGAKRMAERDVRLMSEVGQPPESSMFIRAARADNKWALGLVPISDVPSWAKDLLSTLPQYRKQIAINEVNSLAFPDLEDEIAESAGSDVADAVVTTKPKGRRGAAAADPLTAMFADADGGSVAP